MSKKKSTGLSAFAKKMAAKKSAAAGKKTGATSGTKSPAADAPRGPRGGKPAGRPDRAIPITIKLSRAQYKALKVRGAERGETVQETGLQALVKLFEDEGLSF